MTIWVIVVKRIAMLNVPMFTTPELSTKSTSPLYPGTIVAINFPFGAVQLPLWPEIRWKLDISGRLFERRASVAYYNMAALTIVPCFVSICGGGWSMLNMRYEVNKCFIWGAFTASFLGERAVVDDKKSPEASKIEETEVWKSIVIRLQERELNRRLRSIDEYEAAWGFKASVGPGFYSKRLCTRQ